MKKIYFAPEVNIVKIHPGNLLEISVTVDGNRQLTEGGSGSASGAYSRSFGDDDFE